jgi:hypothetical protein
MLWAMIVELPLYLGSPGSRGGSKKGGGRFLFLLLQTMIDPRVNPTQRLAATANPGQCPHAS